ncbi:hypothetical protein [Sandaracinus amylolyticus]|uniref:hypothetical protein n=1 Tax=Sandaracinus amylolyticus TaxID=927083 RepID=UPI001F26E0AA|nr:hypothetical protein [Sandaracinus amylolyticus]UJR79034.1 Hypothetical protein I5071_10670 [Sandaracinus amylolyticus]
MGAKAIATCVVIAAIISIAATNRASAQEARALGVPVAPIALIGEVAPGVARARVRVTSSERGLVLYRVTREVRAWEPPEDGDFERVCDAPCDLDVAPGAHRLTLGRRDDAPDPSYRELDIAQPAELELRYDDRGDARTAGWITLGVGLDVGSLVFVGAMMAGEDGNLATSLVVTGTIVMSVGVLVGMSLACLGDASDLRVRF